MRKGKAYIGIQKWKIILIVVLAFLILMVAALFAVENYFQITKVTVVGNHHYNEEQIKDIVMNGRFGDNSLYLYLKYHNKTMDNIPFVETMDVNIISPSEINITVYEKAIAGCVGYLGRYMYFDKDGIVVESSTTRIGDIPYVTGLYFDHVVLYEKLPVENESIFREILSVAQLLSKYSILTDRIYFDQDMNITLYFDDARVQLGSMDNIDEKMIKLQHVIPKLKGLKGTLYMENYSEENGDEYITFQRDK